MLKVLYEFMKGIHVGIRYIIGNAVSYKIEAFDGMNTECKNSKYRYQRKLHYSWNTQLLHLYPDKLHIKIVSISKPSFVDEAV